jgi:hypothetical protein
LRVSVQRVVRGQPLAIRFTAVANCRDIDYTVTVVNAIDNAPFPNPNAPKVRGALQLYYSVWTRRLCQGLDTFEHAKSNRCIEGT